MSSLVHRLHSCALRAARKLGEEARGQLVAPATGAQALGKDAVPSRGEAQQHRLPCTVGEHTRRGVLVDVDRVADRVVIGVEDERR